MQKRDEWMHARKHVWKAFYNLPTMAFDRRREITSQQEPNKYFYQRKNFTKGVNCIIFFPNNETGKLINLPKTVKKLLTNCFISHDSSSPLNILSAW